MSTKKVSWFVGSTNDDGKTIGSTTFNEKIQAIADGNADFWLQQNPNGQTDLCANIDVSIGSMQGNFEEASTGNPYTLMSIDMVEESPGIWRSVNRCPTCP